MNTFKRVLAWVLVAVSVLGILVCALGILGSWMINNELTDSILKLLSGAQAALARADSALSQASTQLESANSAIATVRQTASELGDRFENNSPLLDRIIGILRDEVGPTIGRVRDLFLQVEDRVQSINGTIEVLNRMPGIELPTLDLEFQSIRDRVDKVEQAVQQLQKSILDFRSGLIKSLAPFTDKIDNIAAFLVRLEQEVNTYLTQVRALQVAVKDVQTRVPSIIDNITILVTILLLWNILAQVSLVLVAGLFLRTGRMIWEISGQQKSAESAPLAPAS